MTAGIAAMDKSGKRFLHARRRDGPRSNSHALGRRKDGRHSRKDGRHSRKDGRRSRKDGRRSHKLSLQARKVQLRATAVLKSWSATARPELRDRDGQTSTTGCRPQPGPQARRPECLLPPGLLLARKLRPNARPLSNAEEGGGED